MKQVVTTLMLLNVFCSLQAMQPDELNDLCSPAPIIDLRRAKIARSTAKDGSIAFSATSLKGHSHLIKIQRNVPANSNSQYEGEHFFTSAAGSLFRAELEPDHAHHLFDQCTELYAQQEAKKRALSNEKNNPTNCSLQ